MAAARILTWYFQLSLRFWELRNNLTLRKTEIRKGVCASVNVFSKTFVCDSGVDSGIKDFKRSWSAMCELFNCI